ncbi:hypothetical protein BpJC4_12930 [Weizmannia acidilactici]|nr:hypothetical protein BpJC4_12930 [Weizmannia acidilactici]
MLVFIEGGDGDHDNHDDEGNHPSNPGLESHSESGSTAEKQNKGKLILDVNCASADIAYPMNK